MSRIKKRGLDYFPMNTDFMHDRLVRRIMKREGDGAFAILLGALSCIYADEGYYVCADELFYEDLSACLYEKTADDVKRILALAVEYGIFSAQLFEQYAILTSAEIQRQYLFSTKRRKSSAIDPLYSLVDDTQAEEEMPQPERNAEKPRQEAVSQPAEDAVTQPVCAPIEPQNVTFKGQNATFGTHSIAQHSIAQNSIAQNSTAHPLLKSSPETGDTEGAAVPSAEEEYRRKIEKLQPPADGISRNLDGLIFNLRQLRISPQEQYAIILKSNFGVIGHPLWKGFYTLRESRGKIRQPGRYLLSLCTK